MGFVGAGVAARRRTVSLHPRQRRPARHERLRRHTPLTHPHPRDCAV